MQLDISSVSDRAGLAAAISGKSDDEINRSLMGHSADVITRVAEGMKTHYVAKKGPSRRVVIQYHVKTPDGDQSFQVIVDDGRCDVDTRPSQPATVTLNVSLPNFLRLASGKLGGMTAMMTGRLQVSGDLMVARKV